MPRPSQNLKDSLEGKRDQHAKNLYKWQLEASTDGENFVTLLEAPTPTYLGNEVQQFEVDTVRKYNCYRLLCFGYLVIENPQTMGCLTCNYLFIQTS